MSSPDSSTEATSDVSRRRALRLGGGALAVVIGAGAGWLDRRRDGEVSPQPHPSTTATATGSATTTVPGVAAEPIEVPGLGEIDPGILRIGARYLDDHPDEAALRAWLDGLPTGVEDPLAHAATVVTEEFRSGHTVVVDGWVLADSEARAAAVLALACGTAC